MKTFAGILLIAGIAVLALFAGRGAYDFSGAGPAPAAQTYAYPSPSYWPLTPYPEGSGSDRAEVGAFLLGQHAGGHPVVTPNTSVPPDPRTGPVVNCPAGTVPVFIPPNVIDCR